MTTIPCPCCGSPMAVPGSLMSLKHVPLPRSERLILDMFIDAFPREVATRSIVNALWGLDPNGGPIDPENNIAVFLSRTNRRLRSLGWRVAAPKGRNGRVLEAIPVAIARAA